MEDMIELKEKFTASLEPFMVMLISLRDSLPRTEWFRFVERTRNSVINNPDQYLGKDLPDRDSIHAIVTMIFDQFLEEEVFS